MATIGILNLSRSLNTGGIFHYLMTLLEGLKGYSRHDYVVFYADRDFGKLCPQSPRCKPVFIPRQESKIVRASRRACAVLGLRSSWLGKFAVVKKYGVDLLLNLESSPLAVQFGIPYIAIIFDLMHRYYPHFPEYNLRERIKRDFFFSKAARHAVFTVVDSLQGKQDLMRFYRIDEGKIRVIPYCVPWYIYRHKEIEASYARKVSDKYRLPERFIFYPAQFWLHKNHLRLIEAIYVLKQEYGIEVSAVFAGAAKEVSGGTFAQIKTLIAVRGLGQQIHCVGYLPEKELVAVYRQATALVFPGLIGPTNIPPLEAMFLGVPVACSNLFAMPEQVGGVGLLFNPFDVRDIAEKVRALWTDELLRQALIAQGYQRIKEKGMDGFAQQWEVLIEEAIQKR